MATKASPGQRGRQYRGVSADQRRDERRRRLIEAGIKVIGRDSYAATTVRSVCAEAGLTERYFYEAIGGREQLLGAVYEHLVQQLQADIVDAFARSRPEIEELAGVALTQFFRYLRDHRDAARILLFEVLGVSPEISQLSQTAIADFAGLIRMTVRQQLPQLSLPQNAEDLLTAGLVGAVVFIAVSWALEGYARPLEDVVGSALKIFTAVAGAMTT